MQSFNASQRGILSTGNALVVSLYRLLAMKQNLNYNVLVLADRANGRVICDSVASVCRLSSSVVCDVMCCG